MSGWVNDWKVSECMGEQKLVCERERQCERQRVSLTWYTSNRDMKSQTLPPPLRLATPSPARPCPRGQYPAQVSHRQPPNHAAMWVTEVTCVLFSGWIHHFRVLLVARDAKNTQYSTVRDKISSLGPLCSYLHLWMCRWEPYDSNNSSAWALLHQIGTFGGSWGAQDAQNTQQGTVCGTISSHGPLCSYLRF